MRRRAAIAAAVLCAGSLPARPQGGSAAAGPQTDEVELTADRIVYDWEDRKLVLEGHVVAVRGPAILRAARGTLDRRTGILRLEGGVLAVQGRQALVAEAAVVDLESKTADLKDATLFLKDRTAPPPSLLTDRAAVRAAGKNALVLTGKRVRRLPSGALVAEAVTMTPCDCAGEPDFELAAPEVEIKDDRARLSSPRLQLLGASVPLLVPVSLPLTERQSGLLFPPLQYSAITGFGTEVPLFLTLGRSYDLTVGPGIFTGSGGHTTAVPPARGVVGPRLGLQFRYAPVERTAGQIDLDLVRDFKQRDSPGGPNPALDYTLGGQRLPGELPAAPGRGFDGVRGVLRFSHRTQAPGLLAAAQGTLATDSMYLQDTELRELDRFLDALRSHAGIVRTQGPAAAGVDATLLLDVRTGNDGGNPDRRLFGAERRATFQRLPSAFGQLAPARVGPFAFSTELSAARFAPFTGLDPRERDTGFGPTDLGAPNAQPPPVPVTDPLGLGRAPAVRFDARRACPGALPGSRCSSPWTWAPAPMPGCSKTTRRATASASTASLPLARSSRSSAVSAACCTRSSRGSSCGSSRKRCGRAARRSGTPSTEEGRASSRLLRRRGKESPRSRPRPPDFPRPDSPSLLRGGPTTSSTGLRPRLARRSLRCALPRRSGASQRRGVRPRASSPSTSGRISSCAPGTPGGASARAAPAPGSRGDRRGSERPPSTIGACER
jgi:hypothetical protein